ncbi:MAG: hypothetical protein C0616_03295 [Desulfuromonas sp.]|nr:MAG: hypothetical protein C0616_03295 [Desulfuromonas sp.]
MCGIYRPGPGLQLNPGWAARFGDVLFTLFLSFCAYCSLEFGFGALFDMVPFLDDEAVVAVSGLGFLPAALVFAVFTTGQFGQSVEVGDDGVRVHVAGSSDFAGWESVRGFELSDSYSLAGGADMAYARKFQTKLVIRTDQGDLTLVEAGQKRVKRSILQEFRRYAPERLHDDLDAVEVAW